MSLHIGDTAPDFTATTTSGSINFYQYLEKSWGILFSHPADFTPVCTTELGAVAKLKNEFEKRNVKVLALSVDELSSHYEWIKDINETQQTEVNFPIIADPQFNIAKLYGFVHPNASDKFTVRSVVNIDTKKKVRLLITYPASTGRNFDEILRVVDSLQLTDRYSVATPANWVQGEDVVVLPTIKTEEIPDNLKNGFTEIKPYLRMVKQPGQPFSEP
jgi:alkyl hydroperoxide reductase subunit AhpC